MRLSKSAGRVSNDLGRHFGSRQLVVRKTCGQSAPRHTVIFGGGGILDKDHAALAFDGANAQSAVRAGAREHDADGTLALILSQRPEKEIDRQALAAGKGRFHQLKSAVEKRHVAVGRNNVCAVGAHHHSVLDLEDLHPGVAADEIRQDALVIRSQVLDQHERHAGIDVCGHAGKKRLERRKAPGGRADTDYGKTRLRLTDYVRRFDENRLRFYRGLILFGRKNLSRFTRSLL